VLISLKHSPSSHIVQNEMLKKIRFTLGKEVILIKNEMRRALMVQFQKEGQVQLKN